MSTEPPIPVCWPFKPHQRRRVFRKAKLRSLDGLTSQYQGYYPPDVLKMAEEELAQFGFAVPLLVTDRGAVQAGHRTFVAACDLNLPLVPVLEVNDLTPAESNLYSDFATRQFLLDLDV